MSILSDIMEQEGITLFGVIPFVEVTVRLERVLQKKEGLQSALIMAIPYHTGNGAQTERRNVSAYAVPRDYHGYFSRLMPRLEEKLKNAFPGHHFEWHADHSPIDEREAAAKCGLGVFGDNGLFITERYSSYVFLGEILSDCEPGAFGEPVRVEPVRGCLHCGACKNACPMRNNAHGITECLSAVTQKKGELTEPQRAYILENGSAWGCDLCQEVCPYTKKALAAGTLFTEIPYFREQAIYHLTAERVNAMSDEEFKTRAFAWRGRKTVLRNLALFEQTDSAEP